MVSEGNGFANIWNCPVRESNRIVWLLFVNAKMYLDTALCFNISLFHSLVVWTQVKLQHESHHRWVDCPGGIAGAKIKSDDLVADRDKVSEVGREAEAKDSELVTLEGEPKRTTRGVKTVIGRHEAVHCASIAVTLPHQALDEGARWEKRQKPGSQLGSKHGRVAAQH